MTDIRFKQGTDFPRFQTDLDWWLTSDGILEDGRSLQSAMIVALGSDALARSTDVLPDLDSTDRRGWWGDTDAEELWGGWPVGSRMWLLKRAKITEKQAREGATVARAEAYARECAQPFVDRRIASSVAVTAERVGIDRIDVHIVMYRGPLPAIELRYSELWDELI